MANPKTDQQNKPATPAPGASPTPTTPAGSHDDSPSRQQPAAGGAEASQTYDGRQIHPGTDVSPVTKSGPPAADAGAVAAANPREASGDVPPTNRPIGSPEVSVPAVGRPAANTGVGAARVAAAGEQPQQPTAVIGVIQGSPEDRARAQFASRQGTDLLLRACRRLGINPDQDLPVYDARKNKPQDATTRAFRQLLSWQFYPAHDSADGLDAVALVTAGGVKVRMDANGNFDEDSMSRLRQAFGAFRLNPSTREMEPQPLPGDLALPLPAILGFPIKADHVYRGGYANAGGREEAARRDAAGR